MINFRSLFKKLKAVAVSVVGGTLLDPVEVYYEPATKRVYPILSKSGNSSLKLKLIQQYKPSFLAQFPGIHHVDPASETNGNIQRIFFSKYKDYTSFSSGKNLRLVIRNPYERYYSFYLGVKSERNLIYRYPSGTHRLFRITSDLSFKEILLKVILIPDRIADRHFRSQSFYLSNVIREGADQIEILDMKGFLNEGDINNPRGSKLRLNFSKETIPDDVRTYLEKSKGFQYRYGSDIALYRIRTTFPISPAKN